MATRDFSKYTLYRWRYVIGYSLVALILAALLLFAGRYLPGGLSEEEMASVVAAHAISLGDFSSLAIAHLPYYLAMKGMFAVFGVSIFTVKLLSLILGLLSAIGFIMLLRRWFKPNIAVLAALIAITTGQFLFIAQSGTPSILYVFWPTVLLLLGTQVTRVKRWRPVWKVLFAVAAALSLYSPLSLYPLLAIAITVILHPHLRATVRRLSKLRLALVSAVFLALITPLVIAIINTPSLGTTLLGIPSSWPPNVAENAMTLARQYFFFWEPSATKVMTPVFGLGSVILIVIGLYRLIRTSETTRSYLVISWMICLVPVLLLNPTFTTVTYIPSIMMLAAGFTSLIGYWYRLFPLNPYARIAGLIPIIVLVGALVVSGFMRYAYGYHYSPSIAPLFTRDLALIPKETNHLVVSENERPFYEAVSSINDSFTVSTQPPATETIFTATRAAAESINEEYEIHQIITSSRSEASNRLYIYQKHQ